MNHQINLGEQGLEGPGVAVPATAAVHGLHGENAGVRGDRHVEPFLLGTGAGGAEGDGVVHAFRYLELLFYRSLVAQANRVDSLGDRQQHVTLLVPRLDVLHEAGDLPLRNGIAACYLSSV